MIKPFIDSQASTAPIYPTGYNIISPSLSISVYYLTFCFSASKAPRRVVFRCDQFFVLCSSNLKCSRSHFFHFSLIVVRLPRRVVSPCVFLSSQLSLSTASLLSQSQLHRSPVGISSVPIYLTSRVETDTVLQNKK